MLTADDGIVRSEFERLRAKHAGAAAAAGVEFGRAWLNRRSAARDRATGRRLASAAGYLRVAVDRRSPAMAVRAVGALAGPATAERVRRAVRGDRASPRWLERH
jgi:hypothetical protein